MEIIKNEKYLRHKLLNINFKDIDELTNYVYNLLLVETRRAYHGGFKQGEFEMMIELIHGSYDEERRVQLKSIRDEILAVWTNRTEEDK